MCPGWRTARENRARWAQQSKALVALEPESSPFQVQATLIASASHRHIQDTNLQLLCICCMPVSSSRKQDNVEGTPSNAALSRHSSLRYAMEKMNVARSVDQC